MRTFTGRLWLVKDRHSDVAAEVLLDLEEERLRITSAETLIGDWSFDELDVTRDGDEIHLLAEGEELVIASGDVWFAPAISQVFVSSDRLAHLTELSPDSEGSEPLDQDGDGESEPISERSRRRGAHRRRGGFKFKW